MDICECKIDLMKEAVRVGRAHYICPKCKVDVTVLLICMLNAEENTDTLRKEKRQRVLDKKYKSKSVKKV